ncbi:YeiH family putative sulfate export transporter [Clostridia bacterium]|nr:YeiH family putative sulfate export transporter [Clostridia bacterium]
MKHHNKIPGILLSVAVGSLAYWLGKFFPVVGSAVIALALGFGLNLVISDKSQIKEGLSFSSKKLLRWGIILLGATLNIQQIVQVGIYSLNVMIFTLASAFGFGYLFGKLLKINWKMSSLISAGTGICGGSAIAAIAPVIDADDSDIAYAIAATFMFDMVMIILFPILGRAMGLSDISFGLWAGTAVNDTSSVLATGYAYSDVAGEFATIVKLTRTLAIIPITLIFAGIGVKNKVKEAGPTRSANLGSYIKTITPWFILLFIGLAIINSIGMIPTALAPYFKPLSKFCMAIAMVAIGLNTDFDKIKKSGMNPMILGFLVSLIVVVVSIAVQSYLGIK